MATQVTLRSPAQILGDLIRTLAINSDITAFNAGSDIVTLLEGVATAIAQTEASSLKILESNDVASLVGINLDKKAESIRLPNGRGGYGRKPSAQASGTVVIGSPFQKVSSKLYAGKPAPFSGSQTLNLENASAFPTTGSVYVGRGTVDRFEGPIPYTSVVNNGSFWTLSLAQPLTKNHLQADIVTLSQGGDRVVAAGTVVQVPSNSDTTAINFATTQDLLIPDGEDVGSVSVVCAEFGERGNALAGAITAFTSPPFPGSTVRNATTFRNGQSSESDEDLRQRIKNYPATLSRGTEQAILSAILGAIDSASGRSIKSAKVLPPVEPGDSARVFIDDGTGLEPTFDNQPSELLLRASAGQETRFRTAQFPITAALVEGSESGPFTLTSDMTLTVQVDDIVEVYVITTSNYKNLSSATAFEIVRDLNSQSNIVGFRTMDEGRRIVAIDLSGEAETVKVGASSFQEALGLPTATLRPIFLYKNTTLLSFKGKTASLETRPRNLWNINASDLQNVRVRVDSVIQEFSISNADFLQFGSNIATATVAQWIAVFKSKIAGVKFTANGQIIVWSSFNAFTPEGQLEILETKEDGSAATWVGDDKIWLSANSGGSLSDVGAAKDFNFNRFSGEITLLQKPDVGDSIEIATRDTRALLRSLTSSSGLFLLSPSPSTVGDAKLILGFDGQFVIRDVVYAPGATLTPSQPDATNASNIVRATANDVGVFGDSQVGDYFYLVPSVAALSNQLPAGAEGFYRVLNRGYNTTPVNVVIPGVLGQTFTFAGLIINTFKDTSLVRISLTDHGLETGDLITVSTSSAVGGISGANLSVTNVAVTKISNSLFSYQALASATSDDTGNITTLGTNKVLVTQALHGLSSGAHITVSSLAGFGGISSGDLSVSSTSITVSDVDSYFFRASAAATSSATGQLITSVTVLADTWVEFEVSAPQLAIWSGMLATAYGLAEGMISMFRSEGATPQLVDFGAISGNETVDSVVSKINAAISSGAAVKVNPRQVEIHSTTFDSTGTVAVLASIGNAVNLITPAVSSAIQAHTAYSQSDFVGYGAPVVSEISLPTAQSAGYPTRTYLKVDKNITNVITEDANPVAESPSAYNPVYPTGFQHLWLTGRQAGLSARIYNNQTTAPYTGIVSGSGTIRPLNTTDDEQTNPDSLNRYSNIGMRLQDLPVNNYDSLVLEMDLNPTDRTVNIPMAKLAKIQDIDAIAGSGKGQVISFRLQDPEDGDRPFFDSTSVYRDFNFVDFKVLTRSVGLYREDVSDRTLIVRSVDYGAAAKLRFSVRLPSEPNLADFLITHTSGFYNNAPWLNLVATLPSLGVIAGSTLGSGQYKVTVTASGTLFDWRISSPNLNANASYVAGNVLNIAGSSPLAGSYEIVSSISGLFVAPAATVISGSNVVSVSQAAHGLITGDLVNVSSTSPIGGITAAQLSPTFTPVTVLNANTFTYLAAASATSNAGGFLASVSAGVVIVKAPGSGGVSVSTFDAAVSPIRTFELADKSLLDLADAVNDYLPANPVATAEAIGSDLATTFIAKPTYTIYPNAVAYSGTDISGAYNWHSFETKLSGSAGIYQYDSSSLLLNNIKATVQTDEAIFPLAAEASGTAYSPVGELVQIVPTNTKSLASWMNFRAVTSLGVLASIERTESDSTVQVASLQDGGDGAVRVTGVSANTVSGSVSGNGSNVDSSIKLTTLSANARSLIPGQFIRLSNGISSEIQRTYRSVPVGTSITVANTVGVNNYFRSENSIKYVRVNQNTGRIIFLRNGMDSSQSEPLDTDNTITLADLGNGLVQVTSAQGVNIDPNTGKLSARVGDMMYIQPESNFPVDTRCKKFTSVGRTVGTSPEYWGYPVVHVIDDNNIIVIAPNITSFGLTTLVTGKELVFITALWNEKNIRTNHQAGPKFDALHNDGKAYYLIKKIGNGLVSVFLQNSTAENTDTMLLDVMSVNTDDYAVFGSEFDPANQGTYRIVAHNGRNHILIYNEGGGRDEIIDLNATENGGAGSRKWRVGPISNGVDRSLRIVSSDSVRLGDRVRISSPSSSSQWFNNTFFGSWQITGIGLQALDYTGYTLPHDGNDGSYDPEFICPYIDFEIPNAPISISDSFGSPVDSFLISQNDTSIGFVEGTPFNAIRMVIGHAVNPQNVENRDLYVRPQIGTSKFSTTFSTSYQALNKIGYEERTFQGIDGYKVYSGLVQEAHRIIDGLPSNTKVYPGVKAAGAIISVETALIRTIQVDLQVRPTDGVTLNSIAELVKSAVADYVNSLGAGRPVVISEILRTVQSLPGVFSVKVLRTTPAADDDRIVVSDSEKAFIRDIETDVTVG